MKTALLYRISSLLLVLFAPGHTMGFRRIDPRWRIDSLVSQLRSTRFDVQGFSRTYWDFFTGFGFFVTILLLFAAIVSWQLGGLPKESLSTMRLTAWGMALTFVIVTFLSYRYFFIIRWYFRRSWPCFSCLRPGLVVRREGIV
jgi:hypothetical protein